jgi:hypothetical protein
VLLAYFIEIDVDVHLPMFEKFEAELNELLRKEGAKERARRLLSSYSRDGGTKAIPGRMLDDASLVQRSEFSRHATNEMPRAVPTGEKVRHVSLPCWTKCCTSCWTFCSMILWARFGTDPNRMAEFYRPPKAGLL